MRMLHKTFNIEFCLVHSAIFNSNNEVYRYVILTSQETLTLTSRVWNLELLLSEVQIINGIVFCLETTGTETLMCRDSEELTSFLQLQTVHGCDTITKRSKRSEWILCVSGWLYSTEYQSLMKKIYCFKANASIAYISHRNNSRKLFSIQS